MPNDPVDKVAFRWVVPVRQHSNFFGRGSRQPITLGGVIEQLLLWQCRLVHRGTARCFFGSGLECRPLELHYREGSTVDGYLRAGFCIISKRKLSRWTTR